MRDLSVLILDLIESALRTGASKITVGIEEDLEEDVFRILVEDNGSDIEIRLDQVSESLVETEQGKRPGQSLDLLKCAAERAAGTFALSRSEMGGLKVEATMQDSHPNRAPLGDLAATLSSVACTNPSLDLICNLTFGKKNIMISVAEVTKTLPYMSRYGLEVAREVSERIKRAVDMAEAPDDSRPKDEGNSSQ